MGQGHLLQKLHDRGCNWEMRVEFCPGVPGAEGLRDILMF